MKKLTGAVLAAAVVLAAVVAAVVRRRHDRLRSHHQAHPEVRPEPTPQGWSGPTPAYDPTVIEAAERREADASRQRVIDEVSRSHGGQSADRLVPALRSALLEHNLSAEPESWLRAVATELANGHVYRVSQGSAPDSFGGA
ncbi:MAG: hypothetical protein H0V07_02705 [Propionibacteriales bacterium]|nr:hypothetical protein [Propionibacteriales bacterium]